MKKIQITTAINKPWPISMHFKIVRWITMYFCDIWCLVCCWRHSLTCRFTSASMMNASQLMTNSKREHRHNERPQVIPPSIGQPLSPLSLLNLMNGHNHNGKSRASAASSKHIQQSLLLTLDYRPRSLILAQLRCIPLAIISVWTTHTAVAFHTSQPTSNIKRLQPIFGNG